MDLTPITLEGRHVRLEPMEVRHLDALCEVGLDAELWRWTGGRITSRGEMRQYIRNALARKDAGTALPFVTIDRRTDRVVGSTRYGSIDVANRRVEIGWTWVARPWQRTAINTEAKYLLLRHAFESLGCIRIELKTDVLNVASRAAIERIGGTQEGILRQHMVVTDGRLRDSVTFSILDREWPAVKTRLEERLTRGTDGSAPES